MKAPSEKPELTLPERAAATAPATGVQVACPACHELVIITEPKRPYACKCPKCQSQSKEMWIFLPKVPEGATVEKEEG